MRVFKKKPGHNFKGTYQPCDNEFVYEWQLFELVLSFGLDSGVDEHDKDDNLGKQDNVLDYYGLVLSGLKRAPMVIFIRWHSVYSSSLFL